MLIGACFNKRRDARGPDSATNVETIFGSYYLFEALNVVGGTISANDISFNAIFTTLDPGVVH